MERRTNADGDVVQFDRGRWRTYDGEPVDEDEVDDLEPVEQPPDGREFATLAELDAAPVGSVVEDETGNLIFKTASGRWWDEDGGVHRSESQGVHRSESQLVWDGCWLTGEVDTRDAGRDDEDELEDELDNGYFSDEHDWN